MDDDYYLDGEDSDPAEPSEPVDEGFEVWQERFEMEQERLADRSDAEWLEELAEDRGLMVLASVDLLVAGGTDRARLLSDLRDLEAAATPANWRTSTKQFSQLLTKVQDAERAVDAFQWSDGWRCLPNSARKAIESVGLATLLRELESFRPRFAVALHRYRKRAGDLQREITRRVDGKVRARSKVGKQRQHAALALLFEAVTTKTRSVHAQRVATARLRAKGIVIPRKRKSQWERDKVWQAKGKKRVFVPLERIPDPSGPSVPAVSTSSRSGGKKSY